MNRTEIIVPKGIRFLSEWNWFDLNKFPSPCILNKQLPGCGFTEYCLSSCENIILSSPRKMLLENKKNQHTDDVYLVINEMEKEVNVDKDLTNLSTQRFFGTPPDVDYSKPVEITRNSEIYKRLYSEIEQYHYYRQAKGLPDKILVTYDSYGIVKDILTCIGIFNSFYTVVDEMQAVLGDARFKSNTELKFLSHLEKSPRVYFVSATPMLEEFLDMLDEFKNLPYFDLNWDKADKLRVQKPDINVRVMRAIGEKSSEVVQSYLTGNFESVVVMRGGEPVKIVSNEAVFYVNSVNHIIGIIKKNGLTPNQVNILCAKTEENKKKIYRKLGKEFKIGSVPEKGQPHKMFTLCTRTVYLGVDFYSLCARSFIFSDSNVDCLAVDIAEDLPQILGRQRLKENPWHNSAVFFYRSTADYRKMTPEDFQKIIENKKEVTKSLLRSYQMVLDEDKSTLAKNFEKVARSYNYVDDYVAVNRKYSDDGNLILQPILNNLVLVNDIRSFKIQQIDYKDRFTVFSAIQEYLDVKEGHTNQEVVRFWEGYTQLTMLHEKLKYLCTYGLSDRALEIVLAQFNDSDEVKSFYLSIGPEKCKGLGYNSTKIRKYMGIVTFNQDVLEKEIYREFKEGDNLSLSSIKERLRAIYMSLNYDKCPKATDIMRYFETRRGTILVYLSNGDSKKVSTLKLVKRRL